MQGVKWLPYGLLAVMGIQLVFVAPAAGFDLHSGIHGMTWTSPAEDHAHLTRIREDGLVKYYVNRNMIYHADNQPVPGVIYGFFKDQFFAVYIKLRSPNQAYYMEKRLSAEFGPARVKANTIGDQTIYRWQDEVVKIKLKIMESRNEIKLGIYYKPLAAQLNQAHREEAPSDLYPQAPASGQSSTSAPLW